MSINVFINQKYQAYPPRPLLINSKWKQIENFKNKNHFLEKTACADLPLSAKSCDCIQVTQKFSRKFSYGERALRILLGLTLVILTLGIILIFKPIRQLFYKDHVSIKLITPIWLSKETLNAQEVSSKESSNSLPTPSIFQEIDQVKLQQTISNNFKDIRNKNLKSKNIQIFTSSSHVFSLSTFPGWIFKASLHNSKEIVQRHAHTQNIIKVCKQNNFDHLIIPESHLITVNIDGKPITIITEKMLNVESNASLQENLYMQHQNEYKIALTQLVHLICQTGLQDIKWENCPLLFDDSTKTFSKIALVDLEPLRCTEEDEGLFGSNFWKRRGIIRCVPPKHFPIIKSVIATYNKSITKYEECVQKRLTELQRNQQLAQFYKDKGIICGNEPITSDPNSLLEDLDLDLDEKFEDFENFTMKTAVLETIQYINQQITKISQNPSSIQQARVIYLDRTPPNLGLFHCRFNSPKTYKGQPSDNDQNSWLALIVRALIKKGVLFDVLDYSSRNFHVQA